MERALDLARQGTALASPNPLVGAVLVRKGQVGEVVGEGFHTYEGVKHAEVLAIEQAGQSARGATLFVNLEPCCHHGRTGPCTEAILTAGIGRVVAAMTDPNPAVSGRGLERLRQAGVEVAVGLCREEAERLNESFAKFIRTGLPLVTLKAALTLDGKIAAPDDNTGWVTSAESRAHVQQLRHAHDAILTGIGTVLADDPLLTDRSGLPRRRPLLRVVLDSFLRIPLAARMLQEVRDDLLIFCLPQADASKRRELERRGASVFSLGSSIHSPKMEFLEKTKSHERTELSDSSERPDLRSVLQELGRRQITSLLLEAGSELNWAALEVGAVDKVFLFYAPKILGGRDSLPLAGGRGLRAMRDALAVGRFRHHQFGPDFAIEGYLHELYGP